MTQVNTGLSHTSYLLLLNAARANGKTVAFRKHGATIKSLRAKGLIETGHYTEGQKQSLIITVTPKGLELLNAYRGSFK